MSQDKASVNKVILLGNVGNLPEVKTTSGEKSYCVVSLATTTYYKDKEENIQENTQWHRVVCWNKLAEIAAQLLDKGTKAYFEGRLVNRSFSDKGGTSYITEVVAAKITVISSKNETEKGEAAELPLTEDELPD